MTSLRNSDGINLGIADTDIIDIDGSKGVTAVQEKTLTVDGSTTTYQNLLDKVISTFGISNTDSSIDPTTGNMVVHCDGGSVNVISNLVLKDTATSPPVFNNVFNNFTQTTPATDVTSNASVTVFDSLGNKHTIALSFTKDPNQTNTWEWKATVPTPATITKGSMGQIEFNNDGSFKSFTYTDGSDSLELNSGSGSTQEVKLNFGTAASSTGVTQFQGTSTISANDQDGRGLGELSSISVDTNGNILGTFSNGTVSTLAQIMIATFNNPGGLEEVNKNMFDISGNSGSPVVGAAGESIQTKVVSNALEQSNVDLAQEFTNMIVAQRGFQANARVITTSDEFLQELVNLKR